MKKPKTIKGFLKLLIEVANTCAGDMIDCDKITEEESQALNSIIAGLQNDLGECDELLAKFNLEWKG